MIPLWLIALAKNKWTWVVVGTVSAMAVVGVTVHNFGVKRYNEGVAAERQAWNVIIAEAVEEQSRLRREFDAERATWEAESAALRNNLNQSLTQVREQIANAETVETVYSAYVAHDRSVRNDAAERLSRARANYLSSLGSGNDPGPADDGREPPVADVRTSGAGNRKPRSLVVDSLG